MDRSVRALRRRRPLVGWRGSIRGTAVMAAMATRRAAGSAGARGRRKRWSWSTTVGVRWGPRADIWLRAFRRRSDQGCPAYGRAAEPVVAPDGPVDAARRGASSIRVGSSSPFSGEPRRHCTSQAGSGLLCRHASADVLLARRAGFRASASRRVPQHPSPAGDAVADRPKALCSRQVLLSPGKS